MAIGPHLQGGQEASSPALRGPVNAVLTDTGGAGAGGPAPSARADAAHLLRRAGFSPTPAEVERALAMGYRGTVERLLDPPPVGEEDRLLLDRHLPATAAPHEAGMAAPAWAWHLVTSDHPLREKLTLFWHDLFATAFKEGMAGIDQAVQIEMLRRHGMGRFDELLVRLSQDPAMLIWLDNALSTADTLNENYGRELLELFSMGEGSYAEADVRASARAFTGWSVRPGPSAFHLGPRAMWFHYRGADHDHEPRSFLGVPATSDGQHVIAAIADHPATARFIARRLYAYFVDDRPDDAIIADVATTFRGSGGDIRATLRHLLTCERFLDPSVRRAKVKSPIELIVGLARTAATWEVPDHRLGQLVAAGALMGQALLAPPNVGGWPAGGAWLQGSNLLERVNYASDVAGSSDRLAKIVMALVDDCDEPADLVGAALAVLDVDMLSAESHDRLLDAVQRIVASSPTHLRVTRTLNLVAALPEFQYC